MNLAAALHAHLRGKSCRAFMADLKVRLQIARTDIFYYPDVVVVCDPRDTDRYFKRYPKVLMEVLSPDTERTDRREKFLSYTQIETLEEYVLVAQDQMEVTIFRRAKGWQPEVLRTADQALRLASIEFALPLRAVYEGVKV
jgi:Uma2 family endonuclease